MYDMSTMLTIRTDDALREALERRARATGRTLSETAREILREALDDRPLATRIGHLRGSLEIERSGAEWRKAIGERNWRV